MAMVNHLIREIINHMKEDRVMGDLNPKGILKEIIKIKILQPLLKLLQLMMEVQLPVIRFLLILTKIRTREEITDSSNNRISKRVKLTQLALYQMMMMRRKSKKLKILQMFPNLN